MRNTTFDFAKRLGQFRRSGAGFAGDEIKSVEMPKDLRRIDRAAFDTDDQTIAKEAIVGYRDRNSVEIEATVRVGTDVTAAWVREGARSRSSICMDHPKWIHPKACASASEARFAFRDG